MRLSLAQWLLGPVRLQDALPRLADCGYSGVETRIVNLRAREETPSAVGAAARRARIEPSVHGPTLGGPDDVAAVLRALAFASELGARVVVLHPAAAADGDVAAAWERTFAALDAVVPAAESLGLVLTVENMENRHGEVVITPDDLRRLRARYPTGAFGLTVDFCHAATHGLANAFLDLGAGAAHVHLSDSSPTAGQRADAHLARWGTGVVEIARVHAALSAGGYAGMVVAEGEPGPEPWVTIEANAALWASLGGRG